jgi:hypothetical protein
VSQRPGRRLAPTQNDPINSAARIARQIDSIALGLAWAYFSGYLPKPEILDVLSLAELPSRDSSLYFSISENRILM